MQADGSVCFTFEAALEQAIQMEEGGFRNYLEALRRVTDRAARKILQEAALDELVHKHELEKALLNGQLDASAGLDQAVPTMNLDYVLAKKELQSGSTARDAMAYAIHLEKEAVDFYQRLATGCAAAPMSGIFGRLLKDEQRHLQSLEDLYEAHFLTEN